MLLTKPLSNNKCVSFLHIIKLRAESSPCAVTEHNRRQQNTNQDVFDAGELKSLGL